MTSPKALVFVEIDIPYCSLRYGEGACPAVLGQDSAQKCFNTYATCPVRESFDEQTVTLRFAQASDYLDESGIDAIPSITNVSYDPAVLSLGEKSLGTRAKLSVSFNDHPYGDTGTGFDKYYAKRDYDPRLVGTFWGKFRSRHPILNGRAIRLIRGFVGQSLEEMETRHLLIDGTDTAADGTFTIVGKDVLKLADGDRALAPRPSNGYIVGGLSADATTAHLGPAGIGNAEYPSSGHLAIGGQEIVGFTRSGDSLTLTRGQFGTEPTAHSAQDRAQVCLNFLGEDPADIIRTLLVDYAGTPSEYIPLDDWKDETQNYLRRVYTALIAEPTPVRELVAELVEQAALVLIPDDIERVIRLQVLRAINTEAFVWSEDNIGRKSLKVNDQPEKRITNCVTYYGLINPLENVDDPKNYRSIEALDLTDFDVERQPRIKRIFSRWIPAFGRTVAQRVNDIQIGRYRSAPRRFTFDGYRLQEAAFGQGYRLSYWTLQNPDGSRDSVPIQVVSYRPEDAWNRLVCEEVRFIDLDEQDLTNRVIIIDGNAFNLNLRTIHDSLFPPLQEGDTITFIVNSGVTIGSTNSSNPAVNVGSWPGGFVPVIRLRGRIQGMGGRGGRGGGNSGGSSGQNGAAGGTALFTRHPIQLELLGSPRLWGGGGGGGGGGASAAGSWGRLGGGGGGGGAGVNGGGGGAGGSSRGSVNPGRTGGTGTATSGGSGGAKAVSGSNAGNGGAGGGPGQSGSSGQSGRTSGGSGGAAGRAIDGNSFVTLTGSGDVRGPRVN